MSVPIPQFIGARVRRREDPALVTGAGKFVADLRLEGMAHMAVVRSPYPHARIRGIDVSPAENVGNLLAVLTGQDLNPFFVKPLPVLTGAASGRFEIENIPARPPLREDLVRFVGEPVAVVAAEDPAAAIEGAEALLVDYDALPAVVDPEKALDPAAPVLFPDFGDNRAFVWTGGSDGVERAFAEADTVVELRARIQRLIPNAMEPRAVLAKYDPDGERFTLWSTTQIPHQLRDDLAGMIDVAPDKIRVVAPEVGGGFGAKANVYPEEALALVLARKLGRPVRWAASRSEDYLATSHGRDQINVLRLAADRQGRILAADLKITADVGACCTRVTPVVTPFTGMMITGCYDIPKVRATATGVFTNKPPVEPYRGAGRPEAAYLIERAVDLLADELEMDPAEVRRRNFVPKDRFPRKNALGLEYDSGDYEKALDRALELTDYAGLRLQQRRRRQKGENPLGIGIASYVEICGFGPWEAGAVRIQPDGSALVLTGTSPHGQGHQTSWAQIAADVLQMPLENIVVKHGDTAEMKRGIGTFGSRSAPLGGSAVMESSETVREAAKEIAGHLLEAAVEDMRLQEGKFHVVGAPGRALTWREVAAAAYSDDLPESLRGKLEAETRFKPPGETYPFGTHVCVVEIDAETGQVRILRYLSVDDCGRVINPLLVEGQVHGGTVQGIGQALFEQAVYDDAGNLLTGTLMDYALPRADSLPLLETHRTVTPTPLNPLGVKGIGEAATIGSTPAVVNAVVDALSHLGVRHIDTPLTPEKIWRILRGT